MLRNYLVVAWRNLLRHRLHSCINILGLALSLGCCLLVFLFVWREWTFDAFHQDADRLYLLYDDVRQNTIVPRPLQEAVRSECTGIARTVRWQFAATPPRIELGGHAYTEDVYFADPEFFATFSFPLLVGDAATALRDPLSVVVTEELSRKYWRDEPAVGRVVTLRHGNEAHSFTVTGVVADPPADSSIRFGMILPFSAAQLLRETIQFTSPMVFVQLAKQAQPAQVESQFPALVSKHLGQDNGRLRLQPLRQYHLGRPLFGAALRPQGNPLHSYVLSGIGALVLLAACINFANLTGGQALNRAREVGVRKVVGAQRKQLLQQFWLEAVLTSLLALILSIALAEVLLPVFNELVQFNSRMEALEIDWFAASTLLGAWGLACVAGLLAGLYPAVLLSRLPPSAVLRRMARLGGKNRFSQGLVVLQFAVSIALATSALVVQYQMWYVRARDLGFDGDRVVVIRLPWQGGSNELVATYMNELAPYKERILSAAPAAPAPGWGRTPWVWKNGDSSTEIAAFRVDAGFVSTLGLRLVAGRDFDPALATDGRDAVLVNQTLVRHMGWKEPLGQEIGGFFTGASPRVVGVVQDFHYASLHSRIEPAIIHLGALHSQAPQDWYYQLLVRVSDEDVPGTMALLKEVWGRVAPDAEFSGRFLSEGFHASYREELRWGRITRYATLLVLCITWLGILGLTVLAVNRRTKEIGIRKVLGASVPSIVVLLSREFTCLVLAANVIAWPVAWFAMHRWLQSFAYRIELGPGVFLLGGLLALGIAWSTVSWQAIRAALANPVEALRYE